MTGMSFINNIVYMGVHTSHSNMSYEEKLQNVFALPKVAKAVPLWHCHLDPTRIFLWISVQES